MFSKKILLFVGMIAILGMFFSACAPQAAPVPVVQTRIVEKIVEKIVVATPMAAVGIPPVNAPSDAHLASHIMVTPNDLKWADVPSLPPGAKIAVIEGALAEPGFATVRLKFPADYKVPPHFHPVVERVTILSGTLNMGMGDTLDIQNSAALPAGSIMIIQPQNHHFVWTKEETIVQLNVYTPWGINYVNPADDPRKK